MRAQELRSRIGDISRLVGGTPLLVLDLELDGAPRRLYAKAESFNLTGSIKDRMALHVIARAYERGELAPGAPIAEATSGNTGISLAAIGRALGHPVRIFMPDWMSQERKDLIASLGAEIRLVSREAGGFVESIRLCEEFAAQTPGCFLPRQFSNDDNVDAHTRGTGPEILSQLESLRLRPDAFVAGVGTGGTIMGVGRAFKKACPSASIHPLEPANSPTLTTGCKVGKHRIQGISDEFIPAIVRLKELGSVVSVDDSDAILMARKLAAELGLGVGISSGANLVGALMLQERLGRDAVVVTVFPDDNKKYLSTDLMRDQAAGPKFLSPRVKLKGFGVVQRP
ncbi:MAG: cysteine synthase [Elusimicrobia bacterium RIFOXYD12_FULL_66_9]|nr:MAG: cysteine synthase [Elusimicrobia bacterium RIFOXYD12_FULL_66_9]